MGSKKELWFLALTRAILSLTGFLSPFIAVVSRFGVRIDWLWGLQRTTRSSHLYPMPFLLTMAILLINFTFVTLIFSL